MRIDSGREIDPRLRRGGREPARDFKRAAMIGERFIVRRGGWPRHYVPFGILVAGARRFDRRGARRLSRASLSRDRSSRHLDGPLADVLEALFNRPDLSFAARRALGPVALCLYLAPVALVAWAAARALVSRGAFGFAGLAALAASLPAQRSLASHVRAVAEGLDASLDEGRRAVAMIVGRNPAVLDAAVGRAAIESLAENFSDGVVAPAFWGALRAAGRRRLQGRQHRGQHDRPSRRPHRAFGWAAARFDDLVNLPASRLSALFILVAAALTRGDWRAGLRALRRRRPPIARPMPAGRKRPWRARSG